MKSSRQQINMGRHEHVQWVWSDDVVSKSYKDELGEIINEGDIFAMSHWNLEKKQISYTNRLDKDMPNGGSSPINQVKEE